MSKALGNKNHDSCQYLYDVLDTHITDDGEVIQVGIDIDGLVVIWAKHPDDKDWEPGPSYDYLELAMFDFNAIKNGTDTVEQHFGKRSA